MAAQSRRMCAALRLVWAGFEFEFVIELLFADIFTDYAIENLPGCARRTAEGGCPHISAPTPNIGFAPDHYFARINRRSPSAIIRNAKAAIQIATKRQRCWLGLVPDTTTSSWADTKVKIDFLKDLQSNKYGSPATRQ